MADQQLAVIAFPNPLKAQEFAVALRRLSGEGALLLRDLVFVDKDENGKVRVGETTDISVGQGALSSGLWGLLFGALLAVPVAGLAVGAATGALLAKLTDTGVKDGFVKELREKVEAGNTAVAALVSHVNAEVVLNELKRFEGGTYIAGDLSDEAIAAVKEALGDAS